MIQFFEKFFNKQNITFSIGIILYLIFLFVLTDIALMLFASFVIACSLNPLVDKLEKKMKRSMASAIVLFAFLGVIFLLFLPIVVMGCTQFDNITSQFFHIIGNLENVVEKTPYLKGIDISKFDISTVMAGYSDLANNVVDVMKNLSFTIVYFIISVLFTYFFMADEKTIRDTLLRLIPPKAREARAKMFEITTKKVSGYITGMVAGMVCVGVIMTAGLLLLQVKYAVLLGFITAIFDIIPVIGPGIALIITLLAAGSTNPITLVLIVAIFAIAQLVENNVVKPYVFGKLLNLHPIIIYIFLFICAKYLGVIGVIFAPAIAAAVCVAVEELYIKNIEKD